MDTNVIKAIGKGAITHIPFVGNYINSRKRTNSSHSGSDALFCYTLWMKILNFLKKNNYPVQFESIAEIGTGGSLGLGICALLTGTAKYTALEIENNNNPKKNLQLFEEILTLFQANTKVPSSQLFTQINIKVDDFEYYNQIIDQTELNKLMSSDRIDEIKESISSSSSKLIEYNYSWEHAPHVQSCFNFVFSRAVMEHVNSPEIVYKNISKVLESGGIMLHDIEFHSHGITKTWYGHNDLNDKIWKIIRGNRNYSINRLNYSEHCNLIKDNRFQIIDEIIICKKTDKNRKEIYGSTVLARKKNNN